jgi:hypothetical protein
MMAMLSIQIQMMMTMMKRWVCAQMTKTMIIMTPIDGTIASAYGVDEKGSTARAPVNAAVCRKSKKGEMTPIDRRNLM